MKGVLGNQYGKIGPVVARKFRNENVYSAYQGNVANPRTTKQQTHRLRFVAMSGLAHSMACGAIFGFRTWAKGTKWSPRNVFQKYNWPAVTASSPNAVVVDYTSLVVAKGGLSNVSFEAPSFDTPSQVRIDFTDNGANCQRTPNDHAYLVVYCPDMKQSILSEGKKISEGSDIAVSVPADWNGAKVHVWGFTRNEGDAVPELGIMAGECSDSLYCGSGNIG